MMNKIKKLENLFFIAVNLFLGSYFANSSLKANTLISGILRAFISILFFMCATYCIQHMIFKEMQHKYFYEEKE